MDDYSNALNNEFYAVYDSLQLVEQSMLRNYKLDLSICDIHFLHTISKSATGCSISEIAKANHVTLPTVTVAIQKLAAKGFVEKARSARDGRVTNVILTRLGKKANAVHRYFHVRMIRAMLKDVDEQAKPGLLKAIQNLSAFMKEMGEQ